MIPKIIHYCWLSDDPVPKRLQQCMSTWQKVLPDYEFILWDRSRFDIDSVPWVREAFDARMYAFAADYIRFYAVYTMGGIYMDMDVEVLRSFNSLLDRPYILGAEYDLHPEAGVFGSEKGCGFLKWCLNFYENRHFVPDKQTLTTCKAPQVMHNSIRSHCKIIISEAFPKSDDVVSLFPSDYLTAMRADTGIAHPTNHTFCIHHFAGSWCYQTPLTRLRRWLKVKASHLLGERIMHRLRPSNHLDANI